MLSSRWDKLAVAIPGAAMGLLLASQPAAAQSPAQPAPAQSAAVLQGQIGVAAAINGTVKITAAGEAIGKLAESGKPIFLGDVVTTGPKGRLQILLLDETVFTIGPDSAIVIDEFVYDPATHDGQISADVLKGAFRFVTGKIAHKEPKNMKVTLPAGTIGVRGTMVTGRVSGQRSMVALLGPGPANNVGARIGRIAVSNEVGTAMPTVMVSRPGFGTVIEGAGIPPTPAAAIPEQVLDALNHELAAPAVEDEEGEGAAGRPGRGQPGTRTMNRRADRAADEDGDGEGRGRTGRRGRDGDRRGPRGEDRDGRQGPGRHMNDDDPPTEAEIQQMLDEGVITEEEHAEMEADMAAWESGDPEVRAALEEKYGDDPRFDDSEGGHYNAETGMYEYEDGTAYDPDTGRHHNPDGGYYDPATGTYHDPEGGYYDSETGMHHSADGGYYDPATGTYHDADGGSYDPSTGMYTDAEGNTMPGGPGSGTGTGGYHDNSGPGGGGDGSGYYDPGTGMYYDDDGGYYDPGTGMYYDDDGGYYDPGTGMYQDPDGGYYDPNSGGFYDSDSGSFFDPATGSFYDAETGGFYDAETGGFFDPQTGAFFDPATGDFYDPYYDPNDVTDDAAQDSANQAANIADGVTTFEQLRNVMQTGTGHFAANGGIGSFVQTRHNGMTSNIQGKMTVRFDVNFGSRTIGGGNSELTVNTQDFGGNIEKDFSIAPQSFDGAGTAVFTQSDGSGKLTGTFTIRNANGNAAEFLDASATYDDGGSNQGSGSITNIPHTPGPS